MEGLSYLGVGDDGQIYWDGKPVHTGKKINLTRWQVVYAIMGLIIGAVGAGATAYSAYVDHLSTTALQTSAPASSGADGGA